jgi:hypothetical protein
VGSELVDFGRSFGAMIVVRGRTMETKYLILVGEKVLEVMKVNEGL